MSDQIEFHAKQIIQKIRKSVLIFDFEATTTNVDKDLKELSDQDFHCLE